MAKLTDRAIRVLKPREKSYRVFDGGGLYLEVMPSGRRYWRLKYRFAGKERLLALGVFPDVSLSAARSGREAAKAKLRAGEDPARSRKTEKLHRTLSNAESLEAIAREWLGQQKARMAEATYNKALWTFETLLFPWLGDRPISQITPAEVLATLRRIEGRGHHETAHRAKQRIGQVFRYAIATGRAERDPSADLRGALIPVVSCKRAAVTDPKDVARLLNAIEGYSGHFVTCCALKLSALLFVRPGELRHAEWAEIDLEAAEWRIPAEKMKMREAHLVPLARQAVSILKEMHPLTGRGRYVFPSVRGGNRPMSENTVTAALRYLGFDGQTMTAHGFRALASTRLNEMGWPPDVIERQLAHVERNKVRAVYNRAMYLEERRRMMQAWADSLDRLRCSAVTSVKNARRSVS